MEEREEHPLHPIETHETPPKDFEPQEELGEGQVPGIREHPGDAMTDADDEDQDEADAEFDGDADEDDDDAEDDLEDL